MPDPAASADRLEARPSGPLTGRVRAPGDKSISHRALILGTMAIGRSEVDGLLEAEDVLRTARAMRLFGASIEHVGPGRWNVEGIGGFAPPDQIIDCGNSGTGVRLMMGAAAGFYGDASFTGDASLRGRPMRRVLEPLGFMGATWISAEGDRLPLTLTGGGLNGIEFVTPVPSAQVKSAVLLAGLNAADRTTVVEREATRDHTERMLRAFGVDVRISQHADGRAISVEASSLTGIRVDVPGDPSSAAFPLVAALLTRGSALRIEGVLLNPTRIGLLRTLIEMGAELEIENRREDGGEEVGDLIARSSALAGVDVPADRAPSMIDEYPVLAVAAAFAEGTTVMRGVRELRVKESDRIALMVEGLTACGVRVEADEDTLTVHGAGPGGVEGGALVRTAGDHRIAMAHLVLGLAARQPVSVDEPGMIATSFPGFVALMRGLGADIG